MNKVSSAKRFLIIFITSLLGFIIAYPVTYNYFVTKDQLINHSYKDFLLRYTNSPRLIIDSGSNSVYGINSNMLEKELGLLTINLADNGSYPLREKLYRLEKFAHKGDVILLPIEWVHYFSNIKTSTLFLDNLFIPLNFYYHEVPFLDKLDLITETRFSSVIHASIEKTHITTTNTFQTQYLQFIDYLNKFENQERGDHKGIIIAKKYEEPLVCNEYIFNQQFYQGADFLKNGLIISDIFKKNIQLIKKLQNKGIHIMLTWPVVADEDCYRGKYTDLFNTFVIDIKQYLKENNILIVGEPEDSRFNRQYRFDSYYHVIPTARDTRTNKLIKTIQKSPAMNWFKNVKSTQYSLSINEYILKKEIINSLPIKQESDIINTLQDDIFLAKGWYPIEPWGVWSKENESILYVKLDTDLLAYNLQLTIENNLYKTQDKTTVWINDKKLGDYLLEGRKSLIIPKKFLTNNDGLVKIQFNHSNVKSPLEYGLNKDERKIKLGLKSLQFFPIDEKR